MSKRASLQSYARGGLVSLLIAAAAGCAALPGTAASPVSSASTESATAAHMESVRDDPNRLRLFLRDMPKGADLHNHLSGSVYAESFLAWAGEDGMCLTKATLSLSDPPCDAANGEIPAAQVQRDATLYGDVIDAWSVRNWHPARLNGHDQFFESFAKFGAGDDRRGDMLAEVIARAAAQHLSYMELMFGPDRGRAISLGFRNGMDSDFGRMRERLLAAGLRDSLAVARKEVDRDEARRDSLMGCGGSSRPPACAMAVRYLYQVLRGLSPEAVFAQIVAGFELARIDSRFVGFNLVMPEDAPVPMRDFSLHMRMIEFLRPLYPGVRITLHAGELAEGLVPPEGLRFHIRESVERGGASRIGHGTSILHEDDPRGLLREMAERKILVEVASSSSDVILGISGGRHPLAVYMEAGVPVALATDDEGVARSTITREYQRAVEEQGLDYRELKRMARNSIAFSFAEDSLKARLVAGLEADFADFETRMTQMGTDGHR